MYPKEAAELLRGFLLLVLKESNDITKGLIGVFDKGVDHLLGVTPRNKELSALLFRTFRSHCWTIGTGYSTFGWVSNQAGKWFPVSELPPRFTVSSSLDLRDTDVSVLPEQMTVGGGLILSGTRIESLPNWLTVGGELDLERTVLKSLPERMTVGGDVIAGACKVILPSRGTLLEDFDPDPISFPLTASVTVGGDLRLDASTLSILPRGATVVPPSGDSGWGLIQSE